MEYVISLIWILLEMLCLFFICRSFLTQKGSNRKTLTGLFVAGLIIFCISNLGIYPFSDYVYIRKGTSLAICLLASFVLFRGSWYAKLIIVVLYYFALGAIDTVVIYGTATLLDIPVSELIWRKWLYTVIVTAGKFMLLFAFWSIMYFSNKEHPRNFSGKRLTLMFICPLISIVMLLEIFSSYKNQSDLSTNAVIFSFILLVANLALISLMDNIERATRAEQELAILNRSMTLQIENIQALEKSYRAQRTATHEFKHQLQVIYDLMCHGDSDKAKDYVQQLQMAQTLRIFAINTKHPVVDAILNEKYHTAREHQIDMNIKVNDLSSLSISTDALVVLLSNLLDNAIEACQRLPDGRIIECTLLLNESFFVSIRNTSPPVIVSNGVIATTKEPKSAHGFGLSGVRYIIEQQNGEIEMKYEDGWFQVVADLPV